MKRAILLILLAFSISVPAPGEDQLVPFHLFRGYLIVVKCSIGDLPGRTCIVDTGVTETVIDMSLVERLSLETRADRALFLTQEAAVAAVSIPSLQLGPLRIGTLAGIATDLSSLTHKFGIRPDVLIGMDVLHRASFLIDYRARQLVFAASPSLAHSAPMAHDQRSALVEAMVMGKRRVLQVDTGFQGLLLYGERAGRPAVAANTEDRVEGVSHILMAVGLRPQEVRIGDWQSTSLEVSVVDAPQDSPGFDGLLGPRVLHARRMAFDFETGRLFWE